MEVNKLTELASKYRKLALKLFSEEYEEALNMRSLLTGLKIIQKHLMKKMLKRMFGRHLSK